MTLWHFWGKFVFKRTKFSRASFTLPTHQNPFLLECVIHIQHYCSSRNFFLENIVKKFMMKLEERETVFFFYKSELQKTRTKTMYQTSLVHDSYSSSFSFSDLKLSTERNNECRVTSTFDFAQPSKAFWQFSKMLSPATLSILFRSRSESGRKGVVKPLFILFYVFFKARNDSRKSLCSRVLSTWK